MTAQGSAGKFTRFGTYYLYKLKALRPLIIMQSIFALLAYPLAFSFLSGYVTAYTDYQLAGYGPRPPEIDAWEGIAEVSIILGVAALACMFFMTYVITSSAFRYLHKKTVVDMDYALPISDNTRFFGDIAASATGIFAPHILSAVTGLFIYHVFIRPKAYSTAVTASEKAVFAVIDNVMIQGMLTGLFVCFMFMGLCLFTISLCGRTAEARIYPFAINAAIPLIHFICITLVLGNVYGYLFTGSVGEISSMAVTSPLGFIIVTLYHFFMNNYSVYDLSTGEETISKELYSLVITKPGVFIPALIVTLVFFAAAYVLIKKRRNERTGAPFVYGAVKVLIPAVLIFAVTSVFVRFIYDRSYDGGIAQNYQGYVIALLVVTFVLYTVLELISGRGFKKFYITLGKWAVTLGASFAICAGLWFSAGFGLGYRLPAEGDVAYIRMVINNNKYPDSTVGIKAESKELIHEFMSIHGDIIDTKTADDNGYSPGSINIYYTFRDGDTAQYNYSFDDSDVEKYLRRVTTPEIFYGQNKMPEDYTAVLSYACGYPYYYTDSPIPLNGDLTVARFNEALRKDFENVTYERLYRTNPGEYSVNVAFELARVTEEGGSNTWDTIRLYSWFTNTLQLLEQYGIKVDFGIDGDYDTAFLLKYSFGRGSGAYYRWYNATPRELFRMLEESRGNNDDDADTYDYYIYDYDAALLPIDGEELSTLMTYAGSSFDCYDYTSDVYQLVLADSNSYDPYRNREYRFVTLFIPREYNDTVEGIFKMYQFYEIPEKGVYY